MFGSKGEPMAKKNTKKAKKTKKTEIFQKKR